MHLYMLYFVTTSSYESRYVDSFFVFFISFFSLRIMVLLNTLLSYNLSPVQSRPKSTNMKSYLASQV